MARESLRDAMNGQGIAKPCDELPENGIGMTRKAVEWKSIGMGRNGIALECDAMESQGLAMM